MENDSSSGGIGFLGLLTLIFVTLKLLNVIQWGWVWILSPLWIPTAITVVMLAILFLWLTGK